MDGDPTLLIDSASATPCHLKMAKSLQRLVSPVGGRQKHGHWLIGCGISDTVTKGDSFNNVLFY
jgi:hypothetical protein